MRRGKLKASALGLTLKAISGATCFLGRLLLEARAFGGAHVFSGGFCGESSGFETLRAVKQGQNERFGSTHR